MDRLFLWGRGDRTCLGGGLAGLGLLLLGEAPSRGARQDRERQERHHRDARQDRERQRQERGEAEGGGIGAELAEERLVGGAGDAGLGDQHAGGGGDDERGDLRYQAVAHGQHGIGLGRRREAQERT